MAKTNKYALVTGGSRGIGREICLKLGGCGYHVLVNYKSNAAEAEKTAEAYAEAEAKAADDAAEQPAAPAEADAPEAPAEPAAEAPAANEPVTLPDRSEERPVYDPEAPNPNPVEAGPAVAPKDENGKFDATKIADASDFGDWEEQGCKG